MNSHGLCALLLGAVLLAGGCGSIAQGPAASPTAPPVPPPPTRTLRVAPTRTPAPPTPAPAAGLPAGWQVFASPEGGFSVWLPRSPKSSVTPSDSEVGKLDNHIFEVSLPSGSFTVGYTDYPPEFIAQVDPEQMLDNVRDGELRGLKATLREDHPITLGDYTGREVLAETESLVLKTRIYLIKNRLYQMIAITRTEAQLAAEGTTFLNSFQVGEQVAAAPPAGAPAAGDTWQRFTAPEAGFMILFPGTPEETTHTVEGESRPLVLHKLTVGQEPPIYAVLYSEANANLRNEDPQKALDDVRTGLLESANATAQSEQNITLQGYPGRDLRFTTAAGAGRFRTYLVEDRLYQLLVVLSPDGDDAEDTIDMFFNSFVLRGR